MQLGKVKPTATIVAQFAAGVEVETIQHEGKIYFPVMSLGDFAGETAPERKSEPKPEAQAPAKPESTGSAKPAKKYTKDEMMEMSSKDLEKILRKEFGIDPDKFDGKNTNKKLRDLILDAQKEGKGAPAKEEPSEEEENDAPDSSEAVKKVADILDKFDSGKLNRKKAIPAIAEACGTDDNEAVANLLDQFEDDGDASAEDFAKTIVEELSGDGGGSTEEPEGEEVEISDLEKGDRVAVWWDDDNQAWFEGEVTSVKRGKVIVKYDDGTEEPLDAEIHTVIKKLEN